MDAIGISLDLDGRVLTGALDSLAGRLSDLSPVGFEAGSVLAGSVRENFLSQGRPDKWKPLSGSTIRKKGHSTILFETGRLMNSVSFTAGPDFVRVHVKAPYARAHSYGSASVPARPFLLVQDEDVLAIKDILVKYLSGS